MSDETVHKARSKTGPADPNDQLVTDIDDLLNDIDEHLRHVSEIMTDGGNLSGGDNENRSARTPVDDPSIESAAPTTSSGDRSAPVRTESDAINDVDFDVSAEPDSTHQSAVTVPSEVLSDSSEAKNEEADASSHDRAGAPSEPAACREDESGSSADSTLEPESETEPDLDTPRTHADDRDTNAQTEAGLNAATQPNKLDPGQFANDQHDDTGRPQKAEASDGPAPAAEIADPAPHIDLPAQARSEIANVGDSRQSVTAVTESDVAPVSAKDLDELDRMLADAADQVLAGRPSTDEDALEVQSDALNKKTDLESTEPTDNTGTTSAENDDDVAPVQECSSQASTTDQTPTRETSVGRHATEGSNAKDEVHSRASDECTDAGNRGRQVKPQTVSTIDATRVNASSATQPASPSRNVRDLSGLVMQKLRARVDEFMPDRLKPAWKILLQFAGATRSAGHYAAQLWCAIPGKDRPVRWMFLACNRINRPWDRMTSDIRLAVILLSASSAVSGVIAIFIALQRVL